MVRSGGPLWDRAAASLDAQTLRHTELIVVVTGGPEAASSIRARPDQRVVPGHGLNLAAALNLGLRSAAHDLIARMDDDDTCAPNRLESQARFLASNPLIAAVGTAFDRVDESGHFIEQAHLPTDAAEIRWRLLLENCVAHGSVMMRKTAILAAGGYDPACDRAQDYDLWLRLTERSPCIANLPDVLYHYRCSPASRTSAGWLSSAAQAGVASAALLRAWAALPGGEDDPELGACMANSLSGQGGPHEIERLLTRKGPTRQRLTALLWARHLRTEHPATAIEAGRTALLRQAGERLRSAGVHTVWLWGAGAHTRWVLANRDPLGIRIAGIVDDARAGDRIAEFAVGHPGSLGPGDAVLLSSDTREDDLWASSAQARSRGALVLRLYAPGNASEKLREPRSGAAA